MRAFDDLTWQEAMRQEHGAPMESESLYADSHATKGRSNLETGTILTDRTRARPQEVTT